MDTTEKTIRLPAALYTELEVLAAEEHSEPIKLLTRLIQEAHQRHMLRRTWEELCDLIQRDEELYTKIESLASQEESEPASVLVSVVKSVLQQRKWQQGWRELADMVQRDGGLKIGTTVDEIVEQMRKTRAEIFEAEYAHLYR